ncbi:MAG: hypothetical protein FJ215_07820 [Ignavibacteria bacterium]|nr:hypothetical protein [Ignavibacteria bacterium]
MNRTLVLGLLLTLLGISTVFAQQPISAYAYLDYLYNVQRDPSIGTLSNAALTGQSAFQAFSFRRIYFTYDNSISKDFSGRFRLETEESALSSDGRISVFVKDAYIRWKGIFDGHDAILGIQPTPAYQVSEDWWGYRSLEKTIMDLRGIVSSRDFGFSLRGRFAEKERFGYHLLVANGSGNRPEGDKYKRYYASVHYNPSADLQVTLYGDLRVRARIRNPYSSNPTATVDNNTLTYAAFVGYRPVKELTIGMEGFLSRTQNGFDTRSLLDDRTAAGLSIFGSLIINPKVTLVGRYDYFGANTSQAGLGDTRSYVLAAIDWKVNERVSIMPNIQFEAYESVEGRAFDPSVTSRVTFYFAF